MEFNAKKCTNIILQQLFTQAKNSIRLAKLGDLDEKQRRLVKERQESILFINEKYNGDVHRLKREIETLLDILGTYGEKKDNPM